MCFVWSLVVMLLAGVWPRHTSCILLGVWAYVRLFWTWLEVRRNCFCSMESFWGSRCVNVVACPVLACRGVCRPTSVPITWLCSLWKYTAMACGTQVHCTSKKMSVVMLRFSVLVMPAACWGASFVLVTCWSPRFSDLFLDHHVMFVVCDLCRRPGKLCDACLRGDSLHCVFNNVQTGACQSWTTRGSWEKNQHHHLSGQLETMPSWQAVLNWPLHIHSSMYLGKEVLALLL